MSKFVALASCLMFLLAGGMLLAQTEKWASTISIDLSEAYLEDVLKLLSRQSGINFVASEEIKDKRVSVYLDRVPLQAALQTILKANRLASKPVEGANLYLVTESLSPKVETVTRVFPLKYARVVPSAGEILPTFGLSGSLIATAFEGAGTIGGAAGTVGAGGGGIGGGGAGGIVNIIRSILTEHGEVVTDPRTNALIVTDIPERFDVIEETIAQLDVKPTQIFIEAEVLEVTLDTLRRLGIDYGDSAGQFGSYLGPKRTSFFPFSTGLFQAGATKTTTLGTLSLADASILFKLLATEKDVKFLARPRLLTLNNEVAEIRIIADAVTGVTSTSQATTGTVSETVERNTVGTILRVTPLVNDNRYVTMVIEPEVSRVIQSASFSKFLDPNRRAARTTVMVPDGGTVMIAGLISTEDTESARRIPGIGDLPIVGLPFKRTDTERKNTEILLFITPRIVQEQSQLVVALEREQTPIATPRLLEPPRPVVTLDREQTPLSTQKERSLRSDRRRVLKERAFRETLDHVFR